MFLSLGEVVVFLCLVGYGVYLFQALRVRELALQAARRACEQDSVQLLDQTVSMRRISLSRDQAGRWRIWRQYHFEYSIDGLEREHGNVIMLGNRMQALVMADPRPTVH
jgi:hypothetical protein